MNHESKLIPEAILDNLVCQHCFGYLTVLPILVLANGHQLCGRCIPKKYPKNSKPFCLLEENLGLFEAYYNIPISLLGYMSFKSLFPCINKYEGCNKTFKLEEIENHEDTCIYDQIQCPLCGFSGVGTQMVNHFQCFHHKFYNRKAWIALNLQNNFNDTILYMLSNILLLIKIKFQRDIRHISLGITCISSVQCLGLARLVFHFKSKGYKECTQLDVLSEKLNISMKKTFHISMQTDDFHIVDSTNIDCIFKILTC